MMTGRGSSSENVAVDWSPFALLWNRVDVGRVEAERVAVLRIPADDGDDSGTNSAVDIRALRIARLETTAEVSKAPAAVAMQGSVRYASLEEWAADLIANRLDAAGLYRVRASRENGLLSGTADIEEPPAGLVAGLLGLNDIGAIEAHLTGSGPRDANAVAAHAHRRSAASLGRGHDQPRCAHGGDRFLRRPHRRWSSGPISPGSRCPLRDRCAARSTPPTSTRRSMSGPCARKTSPSTA